MITARAATMQDIEGCAYGYVARKQVQNMNLMSNLLSGISPFI